MMHKVIARIAQMEQCFDALLGAEPSAIRKDPALQAQLKALTQYYEGGQWLRDYALDEQGLLPSNLKRGVLSQDALFDFLDRINERKEQASTMDELIVLLYGEAGILHRIESGQEDRVVSAEKEILLDLAKKTNRKYHDGTLSTRELMVYIDVMDVFSSFQHVDWIRELSAQLHEILMKNIDLIGDTFML